MSLGNQITKYRKDYNLTQGKLAEILSVSRQTIARWEGDTSIPDITKINKMCELFNVSIDELLETKNEDENINNQQIVSLIESINQSSIKVNRQHYLMMVASIIVVGVFILLISFYSFLNNERNQLKIKGVESQMNELTSQMQLQQQTLSNLMMNIESLGESDNLVKDYHISFSDMNDTSTNIQIKAYLQSYNEGANAYFNIEDIDGKQYVIDAHLENDYFICNPYTIDNKDIRKVSIVLNSNGELVQDTIIDNLKTTDYTKLEKLSINLDHLYSGTGLKDFNVGVQVMANPMMSDMEKVDTTFNIEKVYFKFIVNTKTVYYNELKVDEYDLDQPWYNRKLYESKQFEYNLKKTDKVRMEVIVEDSTNKQHTYRSNEVQISYGRINMGDIYFSKIDN